MTVGKAIYYLLSNYTDLTDIVATRIFPEVAEQDSALPFVIYSVISNEPSDTHEGPSKLDIAQVDVVMYNTDYSELVDMGVYVRAALDRVTGTYNGVGVQSIQYTSEVIDFEDYSRAYVLTQSYDVRINRDGFEIAQGSPVTGAQLGDLADVTLTDLQDHEALVYDQDTATWINGASTKIGIRVINTGFQLPKGTPVRATGVQGDQVTVAVFNAAQHDPKTFIGMLSETLTNGATGYARQTGAIYGLDTSPFEVGDILYPKDTPVLSLLNGMDYMTTSAPTTPGAKIACAIVLRKHENTGRVYVRTWTPSRRLGDLDDVDTASGDGNALIYNGTKWLKGLPTMNLGEMRDVQDYDPALLQDKTILRWSATQDYWQLVPQTSFLPSADQYFLNRYNTEANTARQAADATLTIERYLTVQADGHGEEASAQTDTPTSGNKIVRKIWHKGVSFEDSDVSTWTLIHTFADDTAYANTTATFQGLLLAATYGSIPLTLAQTWEDVPALTGILDGYTADLVGAFAPALLNSTYTGDCLRVRRASDNAEQDIGFDGNGDLDTTALATFCAGTDGFVVTWYNQDGSGNHATQTSTSNQPKIYDASTGIELENAIAALRLDGTNDYLQSPAISALDTDVQSAFIVVADDSGDTSLRVAWRSSYTSGASSLSSELTGVFKASVVVFNARTSAGGYKAVSNAFNTNQSLISTVWNASDVISGKINGVDFTTNNTTGVDAVPSGHNYTRIGATSTASPGLYWQGTIQAVIIYNADKSADRAAIETALNDYFNVY